MNLQFLTDETLLDQTLILAIQERQILMEVLWHLKEIDHRKLYSDLRCSSLFHYCVKILRYSEGQASRRVNATRLLKEVPRIATQIEEGKVNLTQLNQASGFFQEMNIEQPAEKEKIIKEMSGKSTRETEKFLNEKKGDTAPKLMTIVIREETKEKLKKVQSLNSHKCADMDALLGEMCVEVEKIWDPSLLKRPRVDSVDNRYISVSLKAELWKRDQGKCQQCGSTSRLEHDHIKPFALGGKTELGNLRLLCRNCNQREGMKIFGQKSFYRKSSGSRSRI